MANQPAGFQTIDVAGVATEIVIRGSGRPILYLHGGEGIEPDLGFVDALAATGTVYAPSHPGFGGSDLPRRFSTVDDLAYHYLDLIESLDLTDCAVVGASFGGWIAAQLAIKASPRIAALVLIDPLGIKVSGPETRDIVDLFFHSPEEQRGLLYADPPPVERPDSIEAATRIARNRESFSLYGWSPTLYDPKLHQRLHRIAVPTLLLWGAEDRVVLPAYGRAYADAIPGAAFSLIAGAGHYPHIEQTTATAGELARFLTGQRAKAGEVA
jgi:pimeloyl-ACP methyl ester carboxylesterase